MPDMPQEGGERAAVATAITTDSAPAHLAMRHSPMPAST